MKKQLKRNAKDKVFKNLLQNRDNLAQFYYDLTGKRIDPDQIVYDTIATNLVTGKEEDVAFQIGSRYIILFEAQSTWRRKDIIRFATYMFLLFINFIEENKEEMDDNRKEISVPAVEAYIIYTGAEKLPEMVSLEELLSPDQHSMINAQMKIITLNRAIGMVREYIEFSQLETDYYRKNKRTKSDVLELIDYCVKHNILKEYMLSHEKEVTNLIENFFTEERRIQGLINDAVYEKQQELEKVQAENKAKEELLAKTRANEIIHLFELNIPKERIIEVTGYPVELVEEVLNKTE